MPTITSAPGLTAPHCLQARAGGEFAEFRRPPHRAGIELYRATLARLAFAPHVHDAYGIGAIAAGVERFRYAGSEHLAPAGTLVFMHPDVVHTGQPETPAGWRYGMLYIDPAKLISLLGGEHDSGRHVDFAAVTESDPRRAAAFLAGLDKLWNSLDELEFDGHLVALIDDCLRPSLRRAPGGGALAADGPRFAEVRDYIRENLGIGLQLKEMAALAGLSPTHFLRAFRRACGGTPHQYLQACRVAAAKRLLARGEAPATVAALVGFADQSHLNRWFYRTHGTTPGRYRRQTQAQSDPRPAR